MRLCARLLAVSALCISYVTAGTTKLAGPFDLAFRRIEHCEDEGTQEMDYHTKLNKINKYEYAYNGDFTLPDTTGISIAGTAFKKMLSGSWAKTYEHRFDDACVDVKTHFPEFFRLYTEEYLNITAECPIPGDTYKAENWIVFIKDFPMDQLEYGEYRVESVLLRGEERIGCMMLYVGVEEKLEN